MSRRFHESQLSAVSSATNVAAPCLAGFMACNVSNVSPQMQHLWQAIYQAAFAQAMMNALSDLQPDKYQKLMYRVCLN